VRNPTKAPTRRNGQSLPGAFGLIPGEKQALLYAGITGGSGYSVCVEKW